MPKNFSEFANLLTAGAWSIDGVLDLDVQKVLIEIEGKEMTIEIPSGTYQNFNGAVTFNIKRPLKLALVRQNGKSIAGRTTIAHERTEKEYEFEFTPTKNPDLVYLTISRDASVAYGPQIRVLLFKL